MPNRTAPEGGYEFGRKRHYRREIWASFRRWAGPARSEANCLLMPSSEGTEIEVALQNGFREENLHVVDRNPAIVAHLKRRFPRIHTYGVELSKAAQRIADKCSIDFANFDLCGNVGRPLLRTLQDAEICLAKPWQEAGRGAIVAATCLRGREQAQATRMLALLSAKEGALPGLAELDKQRLIAMGIALSYLPLDDRGGLFCSTDCDEELSTIACLLKSGSYRSSTRQTMLWGMYHIREFHERPNDL
jgi:hypothetical protein